MVSVDLAPFRTVPVGPETVAFPPVDVHGLPWEVTAAISVTGTVVADPRKCREAAGLPKEAPLVAVLEVWCDDTYWSDAATTPLREQAGPVPLEVVAPPGMVYGRLGYRRLVALGADLDHDTPDIAHHRGNILAVSPHGSVNLSGDGGQFPTEVIDFATAGLVGDARWSIRFRYESLDDPVLGTVALMLNEGSPVVRVLRGREQAPDELQAAYGRELRRFVVTEIVRQAVADEQLVDGVDWADHSVGDLLAGILGRFCGGRSVRELRTLAAQDRERFEMILTGAVPDVH